ncbi:MAG: dihydrofolate reductase family protein [Planctomycetota bacterium]
MPGARPEWMESFAVTMDAMRKYVVSSTLPQVDWNAQLLRGDLKEEVLALKAQPGRGIATGGVTLPRALAALGLIDEYEIIVHPRIAGVGPKLFDGIPAPIELDLIGRVELAGGLTALRFQPKS